MRTIPFTKVTAPSSGYPLFEGLASGGGQINRNGSAPNYGNTLTDANGVTYTDVGVNDRGTDVIVIDLNSAH